MGVFEAWLVALEDWLAGLGTAAPAAYVALCVAAAVFLVPGSFLKWLAGTLFGAVFGTLYAFLGTYLGALAAFAVARYGPRRLVEKRLRTHPRMDDFDRSLAEDGLKIVLLLRVSPLVPYAGLNYVLGLTRVRFVDYALASPAMLPTVFMYVYAGTLSRRAVAVLGGNETMTVLEVVMLVVGLAATVAATWIVARKARAALRGAARRSRGAGPSVRPGDP
ncbi:MAG: TVP38/TMEM64 family protein [Myxococcota bacterium]